LDELNSTADTGHRIEAILRARGYTQITPYLVNQGRHVILKALAPRSGEVEVFYCLYKTALFHTYSLQFDDADEEGFGESINLEFYGAIRRSSMLTSILIGYPNGYIYEVSPMNLHDYFDKHHRIRVQNDSLETTFSFPISLSARWDATWTSEELTKWIENRRLSDRLRAAFRRLKERLFPCMPDVVRGVCDTLCEIK
jgi:hypothetical protein